MARVSVRKNLRRTVRFPPSISLLSGRALVSVFSTQLLGKLQNIDRRFQVEALHFLELELVFECGAGPSLLMMAPG